MSKKVIFSGIQPSGTLHIGNYLGAIKNWVELQNSPEHVVHSSSLATSHEPTNYELIFFIVDLHAITVYQDPKILRDKIKEVAALYMACGIDPKKSKIFVQSENPDHAYLTWLFNCLTPLGWLNRMTQFKDKSAKQSEGTSAGLLDYPVLMAADILLYDVDLVPVGEDQKQHIELTRDIAEKFNKTYGQLFKLPDIYSDKSSARIMSLQNPENKMSKSEKDPAGTINLLDPIDEVRKKVMRAVTDSGSEVKRGEGKTALSNLLAIYSKFSGLTVEAIEAKYVGRGYGDFKKELAEVVVGGLEPIQKRYHELRRDETYLNQVLDAGRDFACERSSAKLKKAVELMGVGR